MTPPAPARAVFLRVTLPLSGMNFINSASRALIATIGPLLAVEFSLSATELGLLAAVFFAAYATAQMPIGAAMDIFGVRRVQIALGLTAALGFALCALSSGVWTLALGRIVTGFGVAVGMIAMLTAHAHWTTRDKVVALTGIGVFLATSGGLAATLPAQTLLPFTGWRGLFWLLAAIALIVVLAIWRIMPDSHVGRARPAALGREMAEFGRIFRHPAFWRTAPAVALLSGLGFTYGGLWAGPWLRDVGGFDETERASILAVFMLGMMLGSLLIGQAVGHLHRRGWPAMTMPVVSLGLVFVLQLLFALLPFSGFWPIAALWFAFTFVSAAGPAGYAAVAQRFPPELAGRVGTAMNFSMLVLVFVLQNAIGWILDLWPRTATGGWDTRGYAGAWGLTILLQAVAMLGLLPSRAAQRTKR